MYPPLRAPPSYALKQGSVLPEAMRGTRRPSSSCPRTTDSLSLSVTSRHSQAIHELHKLCCLSRQGCMAYAAFSYLLAKKARDLREVDLRPFGSSDCHHREAVGWKRLYQPFG